VNRCDIRAYESMAGFQARSSVKTWLSRILVNQAAKHRRSQRVRKEAQPLNLSAASKALLRERIETRFREMIARGAMAEALALADLEPSLPATKIIGRRELLACHHGTLTKDEAIARSVVATRQYAKRQDTWFRHQLAEWPRLDATDGRNIVTKLLSLV